MGQGYIAYKESKLTLDVLSQLLKNGIQLRDTLNTLNTLLKIKNQGERRHPGSKTTGTKDDGQDSQRIYKIRFE